MPKAELLNCPFCGGEAKVYSRKIDWLIDDYKVECSKCHCTTDIYDTKREAVEAWNKRVPPTSEQIVEYIEKTMAENREMLDKMKKKHGFE